MTAVGVVVAVVVVVVAAAAAAAVVTAVVVGRSLNPFHLLPDRRTVKRTTLKERKQIPRMMMSGFADANNSSSIMDLHNLQQEPQPMSRTHQYRKVMKPLLERKRRARINKCLDELKDLMVNALQSEGETITKLEKADVLELTVGHLRKLKRQNALGLTPQATYAGRFKAGYAHCAQEVSKFMTASPVEVDVQISARLLSHLNSCIQAFELVPPSVLAASQPLASPPPPPPPPPPSSQSGAATPSLVIDPKPASHVTSEEEEEEEMEEEVEEEEEEIEVALDLSSRKRESSESVEVSAAARKRQLSDDSDSGNSSTIDEEKKDLDKNSWRPW